MQKLYFPRYYQVMLFKWAKSSSPNLPSGITSQFIWFNKKIITDKTHAFFSSFSLTSFSVTR